MTVIKKIRDKILKKTFTRSNLEKIAESIKDDIKKRTRLGYGVENNGDRKKKLAPLAESTKKSKRRRKGQLSNQTTPSRSNLTDTGEMLDSLDSSAKVRSTSAELIIGFKTPEAEDKAEFAHDGSSNRPKRKFMNLSNRELQRVDQAVEDLIDGAIKEL